MTSIQYWNCLECGVECQRKAVRGQRPKYCGEVCRTRFGVRGRLQDVIYTCSGCAQGFTPKDYRDKYCTFDCAVASRATANKRPKKVKPKRGPRDMRSPIRKAYEDRDYEGLLTAIKSDTKAVDDCWEWQCSLDSYRYPVVKLGRKKVYVHRLSVEAFRGGPLGSQQAHHTCANPPCVNPEHVIPVTAAENMVEMKARHSYLARIRELEDALAEVAPDHPALGVLELY